MIGYGSLKEEWKIRKDGAHWLIVDLHSGEQFSKNNHINHNWDGKKRVFTDVVRHKSVHTVHKYLRAVLINGSFRIADERYVPNYDIMIDFVSTIDDLVAL